MRWRRGLATGWVAAAASSALVIAACGGDDDSAGGQLAYLPADAPVTVAVSTDLEGESFTNLDAALQRFGLPGGVESLFAGGFESEGVSFDRDIEPLLDGDLTVAINSLQFIVAEGEETDDVFIASLPVTEGEDAIDVLSGVDGLEQVDDVEGATVFADGTGVPGEEPPADAAGIAVDGDTVLIAATRPEIEAALARERAGEGLTQEEFDEPLADLPEGGLLRAVASGEQLLTGLGLEQLAGVPWIDALQSVGLTLDVGTDSAMLEIEISTDEVAEEDLPIAPGPEGPQLLTEGVSVGARDQAPTIEFALDVLRASVPSAAFDEIVGGLEDDLGSDLPALVGAFGAGQMFERADGTTVSRTEVSDPDLVERALDALSDEVPRLAELDASGGPVADGLALGRLLVPALPIPEGYFPPGTKARPVEGEPALYYMRGPGPDCSGFQECEELRSEFFFGLIGDTFVTAESLEVARRAADAELRDAEGPPGAVALNAPLNSEDLGLPTEEGGGVTLTVLEAALEAATDSVRLRVEASL